MGRSEDRRSARRAATLVAYAGAAATALGALGVGILAGQAMIARLTIPGAEEPPPRCDGEYGSWRRRPGSRPIRLAVIGDSTAAGFGVHTRAETPGAVLATWISERTDRPVRVVCPAVVGCVSAWLEPQVEAALEAGVDVATIFIGANDITARASESSAVRHLFEAVRALRDAHAEVVVATCPDLGVIRPIQPPLRWFARRWSRQLATAQATAATNAGGRVVSLGDLVSPQFDAEPDHMFAVDRYHPSAQGYRAAAAAVLPAVMQALDALGLAAADSRADLAELADDIPDHVPDAVVAAVVEDAVGVTDDPVLTEPVLTEPALAEPVLAEPVKTEPVMTEPDGVRNAGKAVPS